MAWTRALIWGRLSRFPSGRNSRPPPGSALQSHDPIITEIPLWAYGSEKMSMGIEKSGQNGFRGKIDAKRIGGDLQAGAHRLDFAGLDQNDLIGFFRPGLWVDQGTGSDCCDLCGGVDRPKERKGY